MEGKNTFHIIKFEDIPKDRLNKICYTSVVCKVRPGNGTGKKVEGTNTFHVFKFDDIPKYRLNEIWYISVVCEVRPGKKDPNWTRITICGTNVCYSGDVGNNITSQEIFKLLIIYCWSWVWIFLVRWCCCLHPLISRHLCHILWFLSDLDLSSLVSPYRLLKCSIFC